MPYPVSQLLEGVGVPVSATADEPARDALDRMLHHGFSQLPVVKGAGQQRQFYFITFESILVALHNFGSSIEDSSFRVDDALVKVPNVYRATDDLFELVMGMREMNAALIVDDDRSLTHVVTSYDTSRYFRQWAEDIMQVRDIEHSLRRIINAAFKKSDGSIDEDARQSAVEEVTSANRVLRRKFGVAVKSYITQEATKAGAVRPERLDLAFIELLRDRKTAPIANDTLSGDHENKGIIATSVGDDESGVPRLLAASQALRGRFEAGLQVYLAQQSTNVVLDDASVEEAFKIIYDRAEQVKEFGELTLGDYIQLFFKEMCWGRCKDVIRLREEEVRHMLEGVRDTRNILAHFREEEVTAQKRHQLKVCSDWLSERERLVLTAFAGTASV
jgi:CBS domain-containing protein